MFVPALILEAITVLIFCLILFYSKSKDDQKDIYEAEIRELKKSYEKQLNELQMLEQERFEHVVRNEIRREQKDGEFLEYEEDEIVEIFLKNASDIGINGIDDYIFEASYSLIFAAVEVEKSRGDV